MTVPAKWKVVLYCIREGAFAERCMVAALDEATIEKLYHRVAEKLIMQHLIDEIYTKHIAVAQSLTAAHRPQEHSSRCSPRL